MIGQPWKDGVMMSYWCVNTIAPILHKVEAMNIAYSWNQSCGGSDSLAQMLPETLCVVGDILHTPTHVFCSRTICEDELESQLAYLEAQGLDWISSTHYTTSDDPTVIKQKFCTITGTKEEVLSFLGLEVI